MQKGKYYPATVFSPETIAAAWQAFIAPCNNDTKKMLDGCALSVSRDHLMWKYDSEEEFFSDYRDGFPEATYFRFGAGVAFHLQVYGRSTSLEVTLPSRSDIEGVFEVFERAAERSKVDVPPEKPTVFIGHGRNAAWRDLKDHLHDKHGIAIEAYEIGARAGHTIRDILESMLEKSSFALLVLTGEDETADGQLFARQNVVHEAGLFQGHLGFSRAIIMLEEGVQEFSNIAGLQQLRFSKGNIRETFGDVLATLRREFVIAS